MACGHDVDVTDVSGTSPAQSQAPTSVECPRCGHRQAVDIYPLTALSDPNNVGWVREEPAEEADDDAFTQWHECEIELWEGEYDR